MYRIRCQYDCENWAYFKRCRALQKHAPDDFQVDIGAWHPCKTIDEWPEGVRYDLVLQLVPDCPRVREQLDARGMQDTIIVAGLNVGYGHHTERLRMCSDKSDHIVVNNRDCWDRLGQPDGMTWISNGVDLDTFRVVRPIVDRPFTVLWIGGEFHTIHTNVKGWHEVLVPLMKALDAGKIAHDFRRVRSERPDLCMSEAAMVDYYNSGSVILCTSSSEGTPNPVLEAAACGCVPVTTPVGNMPEFIQHGWNGLLIERAVDSAMRGIVAARDDLVRLARNAQQTVAGWNWQGAAEKYFALFRRLLTRRR